MQYSADGSTMGEYLLTSPELGRELDRRAAIGVRTYRATTRRLTGQTATSIRVTREIGGFRRRDRQVRKLIAFGDGALSLEFGNRQNKKPSRPLRRTIPVIEAG